MCSVSLNVNPTLQQGVCIEYESSHYTCKISWANVVPSITLFGGISSSYYKELPF